MRTTAQGGRFEGDRGEWLARTAAALETGARYVDVEWARDGSDPLAGLDPSRVILSHHGSPCREPDLQRLHGEMAASSARRLKIVPTATALGEVGALRELLAAASRDGGGDRRLTCFAAGRPGAISRLLAPTWGSWATYGALDRGRETAAGQFTAEDLLTVYDVDGMRSGQRRFLLIGSGVFGSPSPAMHAAGYRSLGIDAAYLPVELDRFDDLPPLVEPGGVLAATGLAVTVPHKEAAARRCRERDPIVSEAGAANTVLIDADGWRGFNTDAPAALAAIRDRVDPQGKEVAVAGAGGTAAALALALRGAGARVTIYNRSPERARRLARRIGVRSRPFAALEDATWDILVNGTPLGSQGEELLPAERLVGSLVLDAVYGAEPTPLVREARRRGLSAIEGFELLVGQAVLQFARMTGHAPDAAVLEAAGSAWLARRSRDVPEV